VVTARSAPAAECMAQLAGRRVLLVEDNALNQQLAVELLEERGIKVVVADNGKQALACLSKEGFDLVFMDIQMPIMDGYEATRRVRLMPEYAKLPIIALTAHAMAEERARCLAVGIDDVLTKPVDPVDLDRMLVHFLVDKAVARAAPRAHEAVSSSAADPVLDTAVGMRYAGGKPDLYLRLLTRFRETQHDLMGRLDDAFDSGDEVEAYRLVHTLKSTSATIGAVRLSETAREFERSFEAGKAKDAKARMAGLRTEFGDVLEAIGNRIDHPETIR